MTEQIAVNYCATHPTVETNLRCSRCEKFICPKCMVHTPTGYKCKECVAGQQKVFETALWHDYLVGPIIAAPLALLGSLIVPQMGFFSIFLSPLAGGIISEIVRFALRRRRSRDLFVAITASAVLGSLPLPLLGLIGLAFFPQMRYGGLLDLLWIGIYTVIMSSTLHYRLTGIQLRR